MAWDTRLLTPTYISPNGIPFIFQYEDVSVESDKKTAAFTFPEIDGAYIQDLGRGGRRFPLVIFFSGPDYDLASDAFLSSLEVKGVGTLIHPKYGPRSVVPTGTITRRDDLVTAANQAAFSVTFSETLTGLLFPDSIEDILTIIKAALALFQTVTSAQFATDIIANTAKEIISLQQKFDLQRLIVDQGFGTIVKVSEDLAAAFTAVNNSVTENIANIAEFPDQVSSQLITLMRIPSQIADNIAESTAIYQRMIGVETAVIYEPAASSNAPDNAFRSATVQALSALVANGESAINNAFQTRKEAIEVSEQLLDSLESVQKWHDENITALGVIDTGESYSAMLDVITRVTAYLINLSFDLPAERVLILGKDRNVIELASELYGDPEKADFIIQTNNLTADEIEILPQGTTVVYYA